MQVSECCCGGTLKDVVHNHTVELDLEMVISILKDVAAAMAYLHQLDQPLGHQPLCSTRVSLNLTPSPVRSGWDVRSVASGFLLWTGICLIDCLID